MKVNKIYYLLLFLVTTICSQAQTIESYSSWNSIILDYKINNDFYLKNESHFRRTNFLENWQQILIRPSIHYKLDKSVDLSVGYTYAKNFRQNINFVENGTWEQFMLTQHHGKSTFKHRFRLEQRFIDQVIKQADNSYGIGSTDFKMRLRYRFTWGIPLFKVSENKHVSFTAFDEVWLNTNKGIKPKSLNQNWFYVGLSYPIFKNASIGMGYLNTYAPKGANIFSCNNVLQTTFKYHFNK